MRRPRPSRVAGLLSVLLVLCGLLEALTVNVASNTLPDSWKGWLPWVVWPGAVLFAAIGFRLRAVAQRLDAAAPVRDVNAAFRQLAEEVRAELRSWEAWRRADDPVTIPVRWHVAPDALMDHLRVIRGAHGRARPRPLRPDGELRDAVGFYRDLESRRLVILGRGGSGKTVLAARLALDLLGPPLQDRRIPVIVGIASWDPGSDFWSWLAGQLVRDHRWLGDPGPSGARLVDGLIAARRILPILDGFDEMAEGLRQQALQKLNRALGTSPLILTSRREEYERASAAARTLVAAATIELDDLSVADLAGYLPLTTTRTVERTDVGVWEPVLGYLRGKSGAAVREALSTPLMAYLARTEYSESSDRDPTELIKSGYTDQADVESDLLDRYLGNVYPSQRDRANRWDARQAERYLRYLARSIHGQDLAWWLLRDTVPRRTRAVWGGLTVGGLVGLCYGLVYGLAYGPTYGLVNGLIAAAVVGSNSDTQCTASGEGHFSGSSSGTRSPCGPRPTGTSTAWASSRWPPASCSHH